VLRKRLWARLFGVEDAVVEDVDFDEERESLVLSVRPKSKARNRCGDLSEEVPSIRPRAWASMLACS